MKAWRAIDAVGIEQSHGRHLEMGADSRHILWQGRAFEEAECTTRVKLNVQVLKTRASCQFSEAISKCKNCFFSHTSLPRTRFRSAGRAPGGRERSARDFARRCPIRHGTRHRATTSRPNCARGRPSRARCPALLFFWRRQCERALHFPKSRTRAAADGRYAGR